MQSIVQISLSTVLVCCTVACHKETPAPVAPVKTPAALVPAENENMHARNLELAKRAHDNPDAKIVFLGDSITQGWEQKARELWARELPGNIALNLGVSGDRTEHVLWRLAQGSYDGLHPKVIVMMLGTNNTGHRMDPPADIAAGIKEILAQLKQRFPDSRLVLLAIFPRGERPEDPMRKNNDAANALLVDVAKQAGAEWLDLTRSFVDAGGFLSTEVMPDLVHPSARGYQIWADAMREPMLHWLQ